MQGSEHSTAFVASSAQSRRFFRRTRCASHALTNHDRRETESWLVERRRSSQAEREAWTRDNLQRD